MNKKLTISRVLTGNSGTFGVLIFENIPFAVTLEREWLDNARNISCIPAGEYVCKRVNSPKFGSTFEVTEVPGRSHILFHKGNIDDDSHGCILIGEQFGEIGYNKGIKASAQGYGEFMAILSHDMEFNLVIVDNWKPREHAN